MFERIEVALDGSSHAERALPFAESLANHFDSTIQLVAVHEPIGALNEDAWDDGAQDRAAEYLERVRDDIAERYEGEVETSCLRGRPHECLLEFAHRTEANLIVLATHGRGGLARAWLGSVTDKLLRESDVPLLVVRPSEDAPATADTDFRRILVPIDRLDLESGLLEIIRNLAGAYDSEVVFVQAMPTPTAAASPFLRATPEVKEEVIEQRRAEIAATLDQYVQWCESRGIRARSRVQLGAQAGIAICRVAEEERADLIAMTTSGLSGVKRAILGSVSDKVIRMADIPVLIHRVPDAD